MLELINKKEMPLLFRQRASFWFKGEGATPSRATLVKDVANNLKCKPEQVVIKHIYPKYGENRVKIIAHVYLKADKIEKYEHKNLVAKHRKQEVPKEEEKEEEKNGKESAQE